MRALVYHGGHDVKVDTVPDPVIQQPDDIIIKITATAICGSDLHLYRGKIPTLKSGDILGHEFMGIVVEAGPGVTNLKKGDRVVVPFVIACGSCFFCDMQLFSACETTNPDGDTVMNQKSLRSGKALRQCIAAVRRGGTVSVPGLYAGFIHGFMFGDVFEKGVSFKTGQTHVQKFMPELLECIEAGKLNPEALISHRLPLEQAAAGYKMFDLKEDDCRKVVLIPG